MFSSMKENFLIYLLLLVDYGFMSVYPVQTPSSVVDGTDCVGGGCNAGGCGYKCTHTIIWKNKYMINIIIWPIIWQM